MSTIELLPDAIQEAIDRIERSWLKRGLPAYYELRTGKRATRFIHIRHLTAAHCEQLAEHHLRRAKLALLRFDVEARPGTARTAADHVCRTRLYRSLYRRCLNLPTDEHDQPFPALDPADLDSWDA